MTGPQDPFAAPDESGNAPSGPPAYGSPPGQPGDPPSGPVQPPYGQPASMAPGYGQPGYGQQPYGTAGVGQRNGLGIAALICGILAVVTFWTVIGGIGFGIAAIVLGALGRGRVKRNEANNGGMALAGLILGAVGIVLLAGIVALGLSVLNSDSGKNLRSCLANAGSDQTAQLHCQQEFRKNFGN